MLQAIISILISLNLQFNIIDERTLNLPSESLSRLQSSEMYQRNVSEGTIHDLTIIVNDNGLDDIVITPDVDPVK